MQQQPGGRSISSASSLGLSALADEGTDDRLPHPAHPAMMQSQAQDYGRTMKKYYVFLFSTIHALTDTVEFDLKNRDLFSSPITHFVPSRLTVVQIVKDMFIKLFGHIETLTMT